MNGVEGWLTLLVAIFRLILDSVAKRKARRTNGEPDS